MDITNLQKFYDLSDALAECFDIGDDDGEAIFECNKCYYTASGDASLETAVEHMKTHGYTEE